MIECWAPVPFPEFADNYKVSNFGRVQRTTAGLGTYAGRFLTPRPLKKGYLIVTLCANGRQINKAVHRMVAWIFVADRGQAFLKRCVNHIDGNKKNNRADNLEWLTNKQNIRHAIKLGLYKFSHVVEAGRKGGLASGATRRAHAR